MPLKILDKHYEIYRNSPGIRMSDSLVDIREMRRPSVKGSEKHVNLSWLKTRLRDEAGLQKLYHCAQRITPYDPIATNFSPFSYHYTNPSIHERKYALDDDLQNKYLDELRAFNRSCHILDHHNYNIQPVLGEENVHLISSMLRNEREIPETVPRGYSHTSFMYWSAKGTTPRNNTKYTIDRRIRGITARNRMPRPSRLVINRIINFIRGFTQSCNHSIYINEMSDGFLMFYILAFSDEPVEGHEERWKYARERIGRIMKCTVSNPCNESFCLHCAFLREQKRLYGNLVKDAKPLIEPHTWRDMDYEYVAPKSWPAGINNPRYREAAIWSERLNGIPYDNISAITISSMNVSVENYFMNPKMYHQLMKTMVEDTIRKIREDKGIDVTFIGTIEAEVHDEGKYLREEHERKHSRKTRIKKEDREVVIVHAHGFLVLNPYVHTPRPRKAYVLPRFPSVLESNRIGDLNARHISKYTNEMISKFNHMFNMLDYSKSDGRGNTEFDRKFRECEGETKSLENLVTCLIGMDIPEQDYVEPTIILDDTIPPISRAKDQTKRRRKNNRRKIDDEEWVKEWEEQKYLARKEDQKEAFAIKPVQQYNEKYSKPIHVYLKRRKEFDIIRECFVKEFSQLPDFNSRSIYMKRPRRHHVNKRYGDIRGGIDGYFFYMLKPNGVFRRYKKVMPTLDMSETVKKEREENWRNVIQVVMNHEWEVDTANVWTPAPQFDLVRLNDTMPKEIFIIGTDEFLVPRKEAERIVERKRRLLLKNLENELLKKLEDNYPIIHRFITHHARAVGIDTEIIDKIMKKSFQQTRNAIIASSVAANHSVRKDRDGRNRKEYIIRKIRGFNFYYNFGKRMLEIINAYGDDSDMVILISNVIKNLSRWKKRYLDRTIKTGRQTENSINLVGEYKGKRRYESSPSESFHVFEGGLIDNLIDIIRHELPCIEPVYEKPPPDEPDLSSITR